tara:strand:+ start:48865 stop:52005 length:3141 start_codon:yes stop_codon:yes gene_type:complete
VLALIPTNIQDIYKSLDWRSIGPYRAGRVVAVAGDPVNKQVFYFGSVGGGLWKTADGGTYWQNISDGYFNTASVGALDVSKSDPNVIYAGMGEACIRVDVTHGDGVYRSVNSGESWSHLGLEDTRHISRLRIHPDDPDTVYVGALGNAFAPNKQRGVFRSYDGGQNWTNVLYKSEFAGIADLSMDPNNPRILFASMWQAQRSFWYMNSGGPDSGLYRSFDSGDTWINLSSRTGLPKGVLGRIGIASSGAKPGRIWALIEAEDGGLFRSDNGGESWERINDSEDIRARSWYYTHIFADPKDEDTVYILAPDMLRSIDGGNTFTKVSMPHSDQHDLWIDPSDTLRMIQGNDGGACVSFNGGDSWSSTYNQPTSQFYSVAVDNQVPYRIYGAQQDNSAVSIPSRSSKGMIPWDDCYTIGLSESGKVAVNPVNSNIVYSSYPGGTLMRYDHNSGQVRVIMVWPEYYQNSPPKNNKYRFGWEFPIVISTHDPNILYTTGNIVFKSIDEGTTWEPISPDLTRNDVTKQELSGPITSEGPWAEIYCTIYAFAESPITPGLFWAGTDDGLVYVSQDGGDNWDEVTPNGLPEWTLISVIEPSHYDDGVAYIACTGYKLGDTEAYIYKTSDCGKNWELVIDGIRENDFVRVIREDPEKEGLLYIGSETGIYISDNNAKYWHSFQLNLPVSPIYDIAIKDSDLIVATHGRSFWILDDISPIRKFGIEGFLPTTQLSKPRNTIRLVMQAGSIIESWPGKHYMSNILGAPAAWLETKSVAGKTVKTGLTAGMNPEEGVAIDFVLDKQEDDKVVVEIRDENNQVVRRFSSTNPSKDKLLCKPGLNRFYWDLRYTDYHELPDEAGGASPFGAKIMAPLVEPGKYKILLICGSNKLEESFEILLDPRSEASNEDIKKQVDLQKRIGDKYQETTEIVLQIRRLKKQLTEWENKITKIGEQPEFSEKSTNIQSNLLDIENEIVPFRSAGPQPLGIPVGLYAKLKELSGVVGSADSIPTMSSYQLFDDLSNRLETQFELYKAIIEDQMPTFTEKLKRANIPYIAY